MSASDWVDGEQSKSPTVAGRLMIFALSVPSPVAAFDGNDPSATTNVARLLYTVYFTYLFAMFEFHRSILFLSLHEWVASSCNLLVGN